MSKIFILISSLFSVRSKYLYLTIITTFVGIFKSFVLMKLFPISQVGTISFMQSVIMFISFTQLGLLNGGYRLIAKSDSHLRRINNFIFSYNFYLLICSLLVILIVYFLLSLDINIYIFIYSVIAGFIAILSNWISNLLIADQKIEILNKVNIYSLSLSFLCLILFPFSSLWAAILFVTSQSFILISFSLYFGGYKFELQILDKRTFIYILTIGFTPFLLNILGSIYLLFERWLISADLGIESLGNYYLVAAYTIFFQILPGALNNLEFPDAMRSFKKQTDPIVILKGLKSYFFKLLLYSALTGVLTFFLAEHLVKYFLPQYLNSVLYIKIVYCGLAMITLSQPMMLVFQIKLQYKNLIWIYFLSTFLICIFYYFYSFKSDTSLETYAYINLVYNFIVSFFSVIFFYLSIRPSKFDHI